MKWMRIHKYYLIYSSTLILMLGFVSVFLIYPAFNKIMAIKQEISQEKSDLENKLSMGLNAKKIKEELDSVEGLLQNLDTVFIKQGDELNLLSNLEALGNKHQINLAIKPDFNGQNIGNNITKIPIELKATGNFSNLMAFMNELDTVNFYFIADNLNLKKIDNNLELIISGQVYVKTIDANKTKK